MTLDRQRSMNRAMQLSFLVLSALMASRPRPAAIARAA